MVEINWETVVWHTTANTLMEEKRLDKIKLKLSILRKASKEDWQVLWKRNWERARPIVDRCQKMTLLRSYPLLWRPKSHDRKQIKAIVLNPMHCNKEEKKQKSRPQLWEASEACSGGRDEDLNSVWPLLCPAHCLEFHYSFLLILHVPTKTSFKSSIVLQLINTNLCTEH